MSTPARWLIVAMRSRLKVVKRMIDLRRRRINNSCYLNIRRFDGKECPSKASDVEVEIACPYHVIIRTITSASNLQPLGSRAEEAGSTPPVTRPVLVSIEIMAPPKALLFDIGGVCVLSPFQAILDYERAHNIPDGWINVAISGSKPNGAWHRMERGELKLGPQFYAEFKRDLSNEKLWAVHCTRAAAKRGGQGKDTKTPPVPDIDTEWLLNAILTISRNPDPHIYPALLKLEASGRFLLAALSNTMALPDGHFANEPAPQGDPRTVFDPFVSSAHAGVRKPEMRAYEVAMQLMREKYKQKFGEDDLQPGDVVFLDDIGENLRQGKKFGFGTIKVMLGNTQAAVRELEKLTGLSLIEDNAKL